MNHSTSPANFTSRISINRSIAMQLYALRLKQKINCLKENDIEGFVIYPVSSAFAESSFQEILQLADTGRGNSMISVETHLFLDALDFLRQEAEITVDSKVLEELLKIYTGHQYYSHEYVIVHLKPYIDAINHFKELGNIKVSVRFCRKHFNVERVYGKIIIKLLREKREKTNFNLLFFVYFVKFHSSLNTRKLMSYSAITHIVSPDMVFSVIQEIIFVFCLVILNVFSIKIE